MRQTCFTVFQCRADSAGRRTVGRRPALSQAGDQPAVPKFFFYRQVGAKNSNPADKSKRVKMPSINSSIDELVNSLFEYARALPGEDGAE